MINTNGLNNGGVARRRVADWSIQSALVWLGEFQRWMVNEMKQFCMYCGCYLISVEAPPVAPTHISHSICPTCLPTLLRLKGRPLSDFLDTNPGPIIVVDAESRVPRSIHWDCSRYPRTSPRSKVSFGGEVFECKYTKLREGCGQTLN